MAEVAEISLNIPCVALWNRHWISRVLLLSMILKFFVLFFSFFLKPTAVVVKFAVIYLYFCQLRDITFSFPSSTFLFNSLFPFTFHTIL